MRRAADLERRVLLRMATSRDARMTNDVLARSGIQGLTCADMAELAAELPRGAGAVIVAEETLVGAGHAILQQALAGQPQWSDLAVLVLARTGADSAAITRAMQQLPNVAFIERPARVATLVSAARSNLRARQRQYEVRTLLQDLRRIDQRRTEFLATLAHELRNPLAPLRTTLELLAYPHLEPGALGRLQDVMRRQVDHMVRLVDDLMEVSRVTRGKVDLRMQPVRIDAVIAEAIDFSRPQIEAAGHSLALHPASEALMVNGDAVRLTQVFSNLLNNAAKYTPRGGRIDITVRRAQESVVVDVRDNGVGLPAEMLKAVFEMFVQVSETSKAAQGGLGIGLTLVQSLVHLHGGSVLAHSPGVGHGTTFTVRLPLLTSASTAAPLPAKAPHAPAPAPSLAGLSVLVVDDNHDAADSLAELLRTCGAKVLVAYGGQQALRLTEDAAIQVAILDIGMPGMDGLTLATHLRARPGGRALTLIAVTGWGQPRDRQRLAAAGFDHHLLKPVDAEQLIGLIGNTLPAARAAWRP